MIYSLTGDWVRGDDSKQNSYYMTKYPRVDKTKQRPTESSADNKKTNLPNSLIRVLAGC